MQKKSEWSILGGEQKKERNSFSIDTAIQVCNLFEDNEACDNAFYNALNYFHTKEQAEEAARRVKEVLRKFHEEIGE